MYSCFYINVDKKISKILINLIKNYIRGYLKFLTSIILFCIYYGILKCNVFGKN